MIRPSFFSSRKKKKKARSGRTPFSFKRENSSQAVEKAAVAAAATPATSASTDHSSNDDSFTASPPVAKKQKVIMEVIDLLSDDDDVIPAALPAENSGSQRSSSPMLIDLCMSTSQDEEDQKPASDPQKGSESVKVKSEPTLLLNNHRIVTAGNHDDNDDELAVVDRPEEALETTAGAGATADGDGIELMGTRGTLRLPHAREHCLEKPFARKSSQYCVATTAQKQANKVHCDMCYCWVCDSLVKDCSDWESHCMATDKEQRWISMRLRHREQKTRREQAEAAGEEWEEPEFPTFSSHSNAASSTFHNPFSQLGSQTCRHCGIRATPVAANGRRDWCKMCGRVARESALARPASWPYEAPSRKNEEEFNRKSYDLGTKSIKFHVKAHDPRKMDSFKQHWEENSSWTYNDKDAQEEFFLYRLGARPRLHTVLHSIALVSEDKIPSDFSNDVCASETDAIVLENPKEAGILVSLKNVSPNFATKNGRYDTVCGNILCEFDKETGKGKINLSVMLRDKHAHTKRFHLTEFIGNWFGIFPFAYEELCGRDKAQYRTLQDYQVKYAAVNVPPFKAKVEDVNAVQSARRSKIKSFNTARKDFESKLALECSNGSKLGGISPVYEGGLSGVFKRMFRESLDDLRSNFGGPGEGFGLFVGKQNGQVLHGFRRMRKSTEKLSEGDLTLSGKAFDTVLSLDDLAALITDHSQRSSTCSITSIDKCMVFLESLGHKASAPVEGINVELLPFQLQSLQWAIERETTPGGLESFFWERLPQTPLYFNPLIGLFKEDEPKLVRGGIIAEQMGLGKTVISLALCLKNPAPSLPASGSKVSDIPTNPDRSKAFWDPDLSPNNQRECEEGEGSSPYISAAGEQKRGSLVSRGTLVVCTVSLVGQWIEEARSKLENPGLIYPYHGNNRKKDAKVLCKNAIVVTTYETLASDIKYWSQKSGPTYCPPLEKIRWWRVICDESHCLRVKSGKSIAVNRLVADHKWLVTGTPVNTTLLDLKEQCRFLGLSKVPDYFHSFSKHVLAHVNDPKGPNYSRRNRGEISDRFFGHFAGFFRTIMIRHSQMQKYRGTETTLMSLPSKTERTINVAFSSTDQQEYSRLATSVLQDYTSFRGRFRNKLSSHYLQLMSKLNPLRTACAGGPIVLTNNTPPEENPDDEFDMEEIAKKAPVQYSKHSFHSKINRLVTELKSIRDGDDKAKPDQPSKCLVFTQFSSTLTALKQELPRHGFQFRLLSGDMSMKQRAKALQSFQNDPPTTVFLLNTRAAACGINLTQANKVFLMEPVMNPAVHAQAIGRVYRLGQKRPVEIIRMVMEGSDNVETRITQMLKTKYGSANEEVSSNDDALEDSTGIVFGEDDDSIDSDDEDYGDRKMPAKKRSSSALGGSPNARVGAITSDRSKVKMVVEEFDKLFGYEPTEGAGGENAGDTGASLTSIQSYSHTDLNEFHVKDEPTGDRWVL